MTIHCTAFENEILTFYFTPVLIQKAREVSGYYYSVSGLAILSCSVVQSLLSRNTGTGIHPPSTEKLMLDKENLIDNGTNITTSTGSPIYHEGSLSSGPTRTWANQAIILFSCSFIVISLIIQFILLFMKKRDMKNELHNNIGSGTKNFESGATGALSNFHVVDGTAVRDLNEPSVIVIAQHKSHQMVDNISFEPDKQDNDAAYNVSKA